VKSSHFGLRLSTALACFGLCALSTALSCKDSDPCDAGQELVGSGCFPIPPSGGAPGAGGLGDVAPGGAGASTAGAPSGVESPGNPDATFGTKCQSNADCGGPAPICATDPLFYCTQIDCQAGEANAAVCPDQWVCIHLPPQPSACVNSQSL